jgi:3-oxoacyl-[acyl-carrier-protein] synthase-1
MVDATGAPLVCGYVESLAPDSVGTRRLLDLACAALADLAGVASGLSMQRSPSPIFVALPNPRPGWTTADAALLLGEIEVAQIDKLPPREVRTVLGGHAAGIQAMELAATELGAGKTDSCIVVGVDSYLDGAAIEWLESNRRLARDGVRGGFTPGEAGAALLFVTKAGCVRLGLRPLARMRGVATGHEPRAIDSVEGLFGDGLIAVVNRATQTLRIPDERVEQLYCDINGERHRTDEWGFTLMRSWRVLRDGTDYTSGVGSWGDIGAASAPMNCVLAVESWRRAYASGTRALVWASSPEGLRGAAVLEQPGD